MIPYFHSPTDHVFLGSTKQNNSGNILHELSKSPTDLFSRTATVLHHAFRHNTPKLALTDMGCNFLSI